MANINNPTSKGEVGRQAARALFENGTYDLEKFHKIFIQMEDPTEYKPAMKLVGSWVEWNRLKRDWPRFKVYVDEWKEELAIKITSDSIGRLMEVAKSGNYNSNKWLAEETYSKRKQAGRPSRYEKERAAKEIAEAAAETKKEKESMFELINGGLAKVINKGG